MIDITDELEFVQLVCHNHPLVVTTTELGFSKLLEQRGLVPTDDVLRGAQGVFIKYMDKHNPKVRYGCKQITFFPSEISGRSPYEDIQGILAALRSVSEVAATLKISGHIAAPFAGYLMHLDDKPGSFKLCLMAPYVPGATAQVYIQQHGPMDEVKLRHEFALLLLPMYNLQDFGVAHGDIKPQNVQRQPRGCFKFVDFETACQIDKVQPAQGYTLHYLHYEGLQAVKERKPLVGSQKRDVWALAVLLYSMLTGLPASMVHPIYGSASAKTVTEGLDLIDRAYNNPAWRTFKGGVQSNWLASVFEVAFQRNSSHSNPLDAILLAGLTEDAIGQYIAKTDNAADKAGLQKLLQRYRVAASQSADIRTASTAPLAAANVDAVSSSCCTVCTHSPSAVSPDLFMPNKDTNCDCTTTPPCAKSCQCKEVTVNSGAAASVSADFIAGTAEDSTPGFAQGNKKVLADRALSTHAATGTAQHPTSRLTSFAPLQMASSNCYLKSSTLDKETSRMKDMSEDCSPGCLNNTPEEPKSPVSTANPTCTSKPHTSFASKRALHACHTSPHSVFNTAITSPSGSPELRSTGTVRQLYPAGIPEVQSTAEEDQDCATIPSACKAGPCSSSSIVAACPTAIGDGLEPALPPLTATHDTESHQHVPTHSSYMCTEVKASKNEDNQGTPPSYVGGVCCPVLRTAQEPPCTRAEQLLVLSSSVDLVVKAEDSLSGNFCEPPPVPLIAHLQPTSVEQLTIVSSINFKAEGDQDLAQNATGCCVLRQSGSADSLTGLVQAEAEVGCGPLVTSWEESSSHLVSRSVLKQQFTAGPELPCVPVARSQAHVQPASTSASLLRASRTTEPRQPSSITHKQTTLAAALYGRQIDGCLPVMSEAQKRIAENLNKGCEFLKIAAPDTGDNTVAALLRNTVKCFWSLW